MQSTLLAEKPKSATRNDAPEFANSFTLLRLVLASLVIVTHAASLTDGNLSREVFHVLGGKVTAGHFAVRAFFVVSGYLILQSWSRQPHFGPYLIKRVLRIVPGFVAAYLISVFLVGWLGGKAAYFTELFKPASVQETFLRLVLLAKPETPSVFEGSPEPLVNGALWTITYEFRCYLLLPVLGALGLYSRRLLLAIVWLTVVLGMGLSSAFYRDSPWSLVVPFFLAGNCAYLYRDRIHWTRSMGFISILVTILSMGSLVGIRLLLPIAGSYAILWLALSEWSPLRYFLVASDISYGVYLYGWPTQKLLLWYFPRLTLGTQILLAVGLSMVLGSLSWNLIEKRWLAWKPRLLK
jgi:peptidoglycan/LPS O-acetylase OafA/YrhL